MSRFQDVILIGTVASQPLATAVAVGTLYSQTDGTPANNVQRSNGTTWDNYSPSGGGTGTVTHTAGALTSGQLIVGNGGADEKVGNLSGDVTTAGSAVTAISIPGIAQGRLTLQTGVPVPITDQTAKTSVFWTPYNGNRITVYSGSVWKGYTFSELTLALGTLTSGKNYDVFVWDTSGLTLVLGPAWSSDSARGSGAGTTELTTQDGINVNANSLSGGPGAKAGLYLGTIRTTSTTTTEDSAGGTTTEVGGKRFVWNTFNQVPRPMSVIDTTASAAYSTGTWRQMFGAAGNKVEYVLGLNAAQVEALAVQTIGLTGNTGSVAAGVAIGVDSTSSPSGVHSSGFNASTQFNIAPASASYIAPQALGYHFFAWLQFGILGTLCLFYGNNGGTDIQSGLNAWINA